MNEYSGSTSDDLAHTYTNNTCKQQVLYNMIWQSFCPAIIGKAGYQHPIDSVRRLGKEGYQSGMAYRMSVKPIYRLFPSSDRFCPAIY